MQNGDKVAKNETACVGAVVLMDVAIVAVVVAVFVAVVVAMKKYPLGQASKLNNEILINSIANNL